MYPGFGPLPLNGGSSSLTMRCCGSTRRAASESSALRARSRGAMPDSTDQLCAIESIWHSTPRGRAQRRAVVEIGAAVPLAVPARWPRRTRRACRAPRCRSARTRRRGAACASFDELAQHLAEEERHPDALALAVLADQVHAVVPVAAAHQRQAVRAQPQAVLDGQRRVLVQRGACGATRWACRSRTRPRPCSGRPSMNGTCSASTARSPVAST